jgi:hypothetical protein
MWYRNKKFIINYCNNYKGNDYSRNERVIAQVIILVYNFVLYILLNFLYTKFHPLYYKFYAVNQKSISRVIESNINDEMGRNVLWCTFLLLFLQDDLFMIINL